MMLSQYCKCFYFFQRITVVRKNRKILSVSLNNEYEILKVKLHEWRVEDMFESLKLKLQK